LLWLGFGAAIMFNPTILDTIWQSSRGWPVILQVIVGLAYGRHFVRPEAAVYFVMTGRKMLYVTKLAVTAVSQETVTVTGLAAETTSPLQPVNFQPGSGEALNATSSP
jgi:hypothetical protein